MTDTKPENPLAFAAMVSFEMDKDDIHEQKGMTLRDYFAAAALQGWAGVRADLWDGTTRHDIARQCYAMADAMLRARAA